MKKREKKRKKERLKRGLSTILVALILILVSLAAVGIVWIVVRNLLNSETQQISSGIGQFFISLELQSVYVKSNGDVDITVKRNVGVGDLTAINFIISDGVNSKAVKKDVNLSELETGTFTISASEFSDKVGLVKGVSIVPTVGFKEGNIADSEEVSNKNALIGLGAVSWWKLDGNANDEIGNNHGTLKGNASFASGKFGGAGSFDGGDDYIMISNEGNFDFVTNFTIEAWIKPIGNDAYNALIAKYSGAANGWDWILQIGKVRMTARGTSSIDTGGQYNDLRDGSWHHIVAVITNTEIQHYIDGNAITKVSGNWTAATNNMNITIGLRDVTLTDFNGTIDEVIIFNRSLTLQQVKSLYELNLTSS